MLNLALALAGLLSLSGSFAHGMTLARDGVPQAVIVLPAEPIPAEETAAEELATYLHKISGGEFAIMREDEAPGEGRLLVGPSQAARDILGDETVDGLGPEEFIVRATDRDLLLVGGRPRGSLYAVYSFLGDDLGCRWLTWYDDEDVPQLETLTVEGLDRREGPAMPVRDIVTHTNRNSDREMMKRFLVRNRCQGSDLRFTGDLSAYGGTSHRYALQGLWMSHTLFQWMPPDEYFEANPEYYSMAGGERVRRRQLCFTNPGLREALTAKVLERIGRQDPAATYSLSAMDWGGSFCDCPDCRAITEREGTPGGPLFDYLAELGPIVKEQYPEAFISTLAYRKEQSEIPPRTLTMPDNVIIIFAPIDDNFAAPIEHPSNESTLENLTAWSRITPRLWVWYYPNAYRTALPMGNLGRLAADFRLFKRVNLEGYFIEQDATGVYDSRRLADLQTWLITKLMWDPDQDLDALIEDFTDRHYGPAASLIRRYVTTLEEATAAMPSRMGWNASAGQHHFLTADLLLSCQALFDEAETAVADEPEFLRRVQQARMSLDLACITFWSRLAVAGEIPFTHREVVERYRDTYTQTVNTRNLPERREAMLAAMDEFLKWHLVRTELKPLPPPLDGVPAARVRQLTPETATLFGDGPTLVEDPLAAAGIAATMEQRMAAPAYAPADLPATAFNIGYYDVVTRRQQHAYPGREEPLAVGEYRMYPIGRTTLNSECYVWFDWSWRIQFHDVAALYEADNPDKKWDIYASIRFEGPAYEDEADPQAPNRFYVDRVVLVEVVE